MSDAAATAATGVAPSELPFYRRPDDGEGGGGAGGAEATPVTTTPAAVEAAGGVRGGMFRPPVIPA